MFLLLLCKIITSETTSFTLEKYKELPKHEFINELYAFREWHFRNLTKYHCELKSSLEEKYNLEKQQDLAVNENPIIIDEKITRIKNDDFQKEIKKSVNKFFGKYVKQKNKNINPFFSKLNKIKENDDNIAEFFPGYAKKIKYITGLKQKLMDILNNSYLKVKNDLVKKALEFKNKKECDFSSELNSIVFVPKQEKIFNLEFYNLCIDMLNRPIISILFGMINPIHECLPTEKLICSKRNFFTYLLKEYSLYDFHIKENITFMTKLQQNNKNHLKQMKDLNNLLDNIKTSFLETKHKNNTGNEFFIGQIQEVLNENFEFDVSFINQLKKDKVTRSLFGAELNAIENKYTSVAQQIKTWKNYVLSYFNAKLKKNTEKIKTPEEINSIKTNLEKNIKIFRHKLLKIQYDFDTYCQDFFLEIIEKLKTKKVSYELKNKLIINSEHKDKIIQNEIDQLKSLLRAFFDMDNIILNKVSWFTNFSDNSQLSHDDFNLKIENYHKEYLLLPDTERTLDLFRQIKVYFEKCNINYAPEFAIYEIINEKLIFTSNYLVEIKDKLNKTSWYLDKIEAQFKLTRRASLQDIFLDLLNNILGSYTLFLEEIFKQVEKIPAELEKQPQDISNPAKEILINIREIKIRIEEMKNMNLFENKLNDPKSAVNSGNTSVSESTNISDNIGGSGITGNPADIKDSNKNTDDNKDPNKNTGCSGGPGDSNNGFGGSNGNPGDSNGGPGDSNGGSDGSGGSNGPGGPGGSNGPDDAGGPGGRNGPDDAGNPRTYAGFRADFYSAESTNTQKSAKDTAKQDDKERQNIEAPKTQIAKKIAVIGVLSISLGVVIFIFAKMFIFKKYSN